MPLTPGMVQEAPDGYHRDQSKLCYEDGQTRETNAGGLSINDERNNDHP